MSDQKNPKEASNIFHSIMKASVKQPQYVKCPECGLVGNFVPPAIPNGRMLRVNYICPNGHEFFQDVPVK